MLRPLLFLAVLAVPCQAVAEAREVVRIGVLAFQGVDAAVGEWRPMIAGLNTALPAMDFELLQFDHDGLRRAVAAREVDFVLTNPGHYVELEAEFGVARIVTLASARAPSAERAVGSAVVVDAGRSELNRLEDLAGRRVAVVGREGFGGYQLVWRELLRTGIDPGRDFAALIEVGFPMDGVLDAVANGRADAGIVRACLLEGDPVRAARFKVLSVRAEADFPCATSTPLYPDWPVATLRHTPPALAKAVAIALLAMPADEAGMAWNVPADYQSVHELFRELQIGPYAYLREPTLSALAERYWPTVAVVLAALLGWVLYTVRVEHLVHARTAELREALAQREALEARMRANQEQADHLARLSVLGELSGTLAHELNQPLAGIGNYASSLLRRADNGRLTDDAVREAAAEIGTQAERAAGILARIRAFARKRVAQREVHVPAAIVADAVALLQGMLAHAPRVEIVDHLPAGTRVDVDALQCQQVLLNLLKNGVDAMSTLPHPEQVLSVTLGQHGTSVSIAVRDVGCGLDDEGMTRLFEAFHTTKADGLGLGLSICKRIAEAHGGRLLAARAEPPPGMVFTLILPAHE